MQELVRATYRDTAEASSLRPRLAQALTEAGVSRDCVEVAVLMLSELTSNALRHTDTPAPLVLVDLVDDLVRIAVTDAGHRLPTVRPPEPTRVGGNGLRIIDSLAASWGAEPHDGLGKTVWFTVPA